MLELVFMNIEGVIKTKRLMSISGKLEEEQFLRGGNKVKSSTVRTSETAPQVTM